MPGVSGADPQTDAEGPAGQPPVDTEAVRSQTAALAAGTEAFLVAEGFTPVQRSRRVAIAPGPSACRTCAGRSTRTAWSSRRPRPAPSS